MAEASRAEQSDAEIQAELAANPYRYDLHVAFIHSLRERGDLEALRDARQAMSRVLPLSDEQWAAWADDEAAVAASADERRAVAELYEQGVSEYLSPSLWAAYISFVAGAYTQACEDDEDPPVSLEGVRDIIQRGIQAVKWHIAESHVVWKAAIEFELKLLKSVNDDTDGQKERIRSMYHTQLKFPHLDIDSTFCAYSSFVTNHDNERYEALMSEANNAYKHGKQLLEKYEPLELGLAQSGYAVSAYLAYIDAEISKKAASQETFLVRTLFERAVQRHCTDVMIWSAFIVYMIQHFRVTSIVESLVHRAIRNCPWSGEIWAHHLRINMFVLGVSDSEALRDLALGNPMLAANTQEVAAYLVAFLECTNRSLVTSPLSTNDPAADAIVKKLRSTYAWAKKLLVDSQAPAGTSFLLDRFALDLEKYVIKDVEHLRSMYANLVKEFSSSSELWEEYITFEMTMGVPSKALGVCRMALTRHMDWPERIRDLYLRLEKQIGTFDSNYDSQWRVIVARRKEEMKGMSLGSETGQQAQQPEQVSQLQQQRHIDTPEILKSVKAKSKKRQAPEDSNDAQAVLAKEDIKHQNIPTHSPPPKRRKRHADTVDEVQDIGKSMANDEMAEEVASASVKDDEQMTEDVCVIDNSVADQMVCVTGVPDACDINEIVSYFGTCGVVDDVYFEADPESPETRQCFVQFNARIGVTKALEKSGRSLHGAQIRVVRCRHSNIKWQFAESKDPRTVYVTSLPHNIRKYRLREIFGQFGEIKDIRTVHRVGKPSFAYIEFTTEDAAKKSLAMNESTLEDRTIYAAISDPTKKKTPSVDPKQVYFTNLPFSTKKSAVFELFKECGRIRDIRMLTFKNSEKFRGVGFIEFYDEASAKRALALQGTEVGGRPIQVSIAEPRGSSSKQQVHNDNHEDEGKQTKMKQPMRGSHKLPQEDLKSRIIVAAGFPDGIALQDINELFGSVGTVVEASIEGDTGTATVQYATATEAELAVSSFNAFNLHDSVLIVQQLAPTEAAQVKSASKKSDRKNEASSRAPAVTAFIPRARKTAAKRISVPAANAPQTAPADTGAINEVKSGGKSGGKSNEEFRKLFLSK